MVTSSEKVTSAKDAQSIAELRDWYARAEAGTLIQMTPEEEKQASEDLTVIFNAT